LNRPLPMMDARTLSTSGMDHLLSAPRVAMQQDAAVTVDLGVVAVADEDRGVDALDQRRTGEPIPCHEPVPVEDWDLAELTPLGHVDGTVRLHGARSVGAPRLDPGQRRPLGASDRANADVDELQGRALRGEVVAIEPLILFAEYPFDS